MPKAKKTKTTKQPTSAQTNLLDATLPENMHQMLSMVDDQVKKSQENIESALSDMFGLIDGAKKRMNTTDQTGNETEVPNKAPNINAEPSQESIVSGMQEQIQKAQEAMQHSIDAANQHIMHSVTQTAETVNQKVTQTSSQVQQSEQQQQ